MVINVRTKGQEGEREVAKLLNQEVAKVRRKLDLPAFATMDELFQRNQNQSVVGGSDLSCPMPLEIEIKRQEALSINTWWKQCVASANRTGGIPILVFRQNHKQWRIIMEMDIPLQAYGSPQYAALSQVRAEITMDTFIAWFHAYYTKWVKDNG